jgi:hypothetical protein
MAADQLLSTELGRTERRKPMSNDSFIAVFIALFIAVFRKEYSALFHWAGLKEDGYYSTRVGLATMRGIQGPRTTGRPNSSTPQAQAVLRMFLYHRRHPFLRKLWGRVTFKITLQLFEIATFRRRSGSQGSRVHPPWPAAAWSMAEGKRTATTALQYVLLCAEITRRCP